MSPKQTQTVAGWRRRSIAYEFCSPSNLTESELSTCLNIIRDGGAVAINLEKLRNARMLALARWDGVIVAVGAIKNNRPERAADIALKSGFSFPKETPELGYVSVSRQHRRKGLSHQLVGSLLKAVPGGLFATTDDEHMMKTLSGAGFTRQGSEWLGHRGRLSLWLKQPEQTETEGTSPAASGPTGRKPVREPGRRFLPAVSARARRTARAAGNDYRSRRISKGARRSPAG